MNPIFKVILALAVSSLLAACVSAQSERSMNFAASALTKLSASVDATIRFKHPSEALTDAELLRLSVAHDPSLLTPFENFTVRVLRDGRHSVVLVCEANGGKALLEDSGCTAKLDHHHWRNMPGITCEFTLDVKALCGP